MRRCKAYNGGMKNRWRFAQILCLAFLGVGSGALAQGDPAANQPAPQSSQVVMPDAEKIVLLLRTTLNTLNDALQTGNFTVLRDMGAPGFRDANSAAKLSQSFSSLASKGIDLSAVSVIAPQLTQAPALDQAKGMLHLKGYFPGQPEQINFEMLYQAVEGRWRVFGLSVNPGPPAAAPASAEADAPKSTAVKKK
jgi:hypothetical protein